MYLNPISNRDEKKPSGVVIDPPKETNESEQRNQENEFSCESETQTLTKSALKKKRKFEQMQAHWTEKKRLKKERKRQKALEKKEVTQNEGLYHFK